MKLSKKKELAQKRRWRIRKKINGTAARPRVCVRFTNKNIHAQCVDDENSHTLLGLATTGKQFKDALPNVAGADKLGRLSEPRSRKRELPRSSSTAPAGNITVA